MENGQQNGEHQKKTSSPAFEDASSWYGYSGTIDQIRKDNFSRLGNLTFLDAAGTPPYCEQAVQKSSEFLASFPLSNPHSNNTTSIFTTNLTNHVRSLVFRHFNTDSDHYSLVFTHNTSHSCFLLSDAFPWKKNLSMCAYFQEAHHSLLGMRHTAVSRRAITVPMTFTDFELIKTDKAVDEEQKKEQQQEREKEKVRARKDVQWNENLLDEIFDKIYSSKSFKKRYQTEKPNAVLNGQNSEGQNQNSGEHASLYRFPPQSQNRDDDDDDDDDDDYDDDEDDERTVWNLLTISLESNFTGEKFPLSIFKHLKERNHRLFSQRYMSKQSLYGSEADRKSKKYRHQWKIFVDAAAYVPSAPLDLTEYPIDFLAFSFSKVFGYPTGLGVLLIKKDIMTEMEGEERTMRPFYLRRNFFSGGTVLGAISNTDERHFWHTLPSYCYIKDSSYFSLSSNRSPSPAPDTVVFHSTNNLMAKSTTPRGRTPSPFSRSTSSPAVKDAKEDPTKKKANTFKAEKQRRRERQKEKAREARNYLSDLELDRQFEDGTIPYTSIIPLGFNYSLWSTLFTDFATIQKHTYYLCQYLNTGLRNLKYRYSGEEEAKLGVNSSPVCEVYGSHHLESPLVQGPIVSFNILHPIANRSPSTPREVTKAKPGPGESPARRTFPRRGADKEEKEKENKEKSEWVKRYVAHKDVEEKSKKWNICLRAGAFCNTGTSQTIFKYSERRYKQHLQAGGTCTESTVFDAELEPYGAARVSISYMTTKGDIDHLLRFLVVEFFIPMSPTPVGEPYVSWSKSPIREDAVAKPSPLSYSMEQLFTFQNSKA